MKTEIRYPPEPMPGETRIDWERRALRPWRLEEKRRLLFERGWRCERCGVGALSFDLDEGVIPRADMRGLTVGQRCFAFASCNLFILCARCNREEAHQREWAFEQSVKRYGSERVRAWYASLGLKAPRWEWLPE